MRRHPRRRPISARRLHQAAGQALVVFALISTVLFAVVGLAVDAGLGYLRSADAEKAAAAASLAGVPYMPGHYSSGTEVPADVPNAADLTASPPGSAMAAAAQAAARNGFVNGQNGVTVHVDKVTDCPPLPACETKLKVTITQAASTSFMRAVGVTQQNVQQSETAIYQPPIGLGQPSQSLGADDSNYGLPDPLSPGSSQHPMMLTQLGYNVNRVNGDAFTPEPLSQNTDNIGLDASNPNSLDQSNPAAKDLHTISPANGTEPALTDPVNRGGYNYLIYVPAGDTTRLQVFNPSYAPTKYGWLPSYAPVNTQPMREGQFMACDAGASPPTVGTACGPAGYTSQKQYYPIMDYQLYTVSNIYDRSQDQSFVDMRADPINAWGVGTTPGTGSAVNVLNGTTISGWDPAFHQWVDMGNTTAASGLLQVTAGAAYSGGGALSGGATGQYYRLRVDMLDYNGIDPAADGGASPAPDVLAVKQYSLRLTEGTLAAAPQAPVAAGGPPVANCLGACVVSGMQDLAEMTELAGNAGGSGVPSTASLKLLQIPAAYAGQTVSVLLFDPGDLQPAGTAISAATISTNTQILRYANDSPTDPLPSFSSEQGGTVYVSTDASGSPACSVDSSGNYVPITVSYTVDGSAPASPWSPSLSECANGQSGTNLTIPPGLASGSHTLTVNYPANGNYAASSATRNFNIYVPTSCYFQMFPNPDGTQTATNLGGVGSQNADGTYNIYEYYTVYDNNNTQIWQVGNVTAYTDDTDTTVLPTYSGGSPAPDTNPVTTGWDFTFDHVPNPTSPEVWYGVKFTDGGLTCHAKASYSLQYTPPPSGSSSATASTPAVTISATPETVTSSPPVTTVTASAADASTGAGLAGQFLYTYSNTSSGTNAIDLNCGGTSWETTDSGGRAACNATLPTNLPTIYVQGCFYPSDSTHYSYVCTNWYPISINTSGGSGSNGGGPGGLAYHGGAHAMPIPNYSPGGSTSRTLSSSSSTIPSVSLSFQQPDGTPATITQVQNLGPSEQGDNYGIAPNTYGNPLGTTSSTNCPYGCVDASTTLSGNSINALDASGNAYYNGTWLEITLQVPGSYAPANVNASYWSLSYTVTNAITQDNLTLMVQPNGAPVHLLPAS